MLSPKTYDVLLNRLNLGVIVVNSAFEVEFINHFIETQCQVNYSDSVQQPLFSLFSDLPEAWLKRKIQSVFVLGTPAFSNWEQRRHVFKMRHTRPVTTQSDYMVQNLSFLPLSQNSEVVQQVAIIIEDVTDTCFYQERLQDTLKTLEHTSQTDALTGIANRRFFEERFLYEFARAKKQQLELSLMMFDMDRFKSINDFYGHQAGDYILQEAAQLITQQMSRLDVFARYGGEEFCLILPQKNIMQAHQFAESVRQKIYAHDFVFDNRRIQTSISVGIAQLDEDSESFESLVTQADIALYQSKREGRNRTSCYKK
ncbi:GGDEF domain-containing protein [Gayadomonas joobiniege]|uniref:GGDEF domain-containing protein n=1 Tax=Gayadomonas joobiniege TaxID=1234606 RepID=UPI00035C4D44|nr:diguanylate cyclase [Gayadomonas joobiniege]